jgi:hypothetical protein
MHHHGTMKSLRSKTSTKKDETTGTNTEYYNNCAIKQINCKLHIEWILILQNISKGGAKIFSVESATRYRNRVKNLIFLLLS